MLAQHKYEIRDDPADAILFSKLFISCFYLVLSLYMFHTFILFNTIEITVKKLINPLILTFFMLAVNNNK